MNLAFAMPCATLLNNNWSPRKERNKGNTNYWKGYKIFNCIARTKRVSVCCSLEENVSRLESRILEWLQDSNNKDNKRLMLGLVGVPGSGKTTLASHTAARLNALRTGTCIVVPMDGFHYSKQTLAEMDNPAEAHARRGAPWTFDSLGFIKALEKIRKKETVCLPWFDHHKGDPEEGAVYVDNLVPVVIVEGNYLLLPDKPWNTLPHILDEIWYLDCEISEAMYRVFQRMVNEVGGSILSVLPQGDNFLVGLSPGEASFRVSYNDSRNAEIISSCKCRADVILDSNSR